MDIGIITFHRAINYGAFLQAFALKEYLIDLGYNAKIIDYWPSYHAKAYSIFRWKEIFKAPLTLKIKIIIASILKYRRAKKRFRKMNYLQKKYFHLSNKINFPSKESLCGLSFDYIFYGSDQIWWKSKINNEKFDWVFWGDYAPQHIKKIAYAASMGEINLSKNDISIIKEKLNNFSNISVREENIKEIIQKLSSKKIHLVSDPVFLLSSHKWLTYIPCQKHPFKYILLFNLTRSKETETIAKSKSIELNLPIIEISSTILPTNFKKNCLQTLDAFEFIGYIKDAEYVVTSSFHGTAFSIIFEKQFITTGMGNNAERAKTLLKSLNLENRYANNENTLPNEQINYSKIESIKSTIISSSISFIKSSLS